MSLFPFIRRSTKGRQGEFDIDVVAAINLNRIFITHSNSDHRKAVRLIKNWRSSFVHGSFPKSQRIFFDNFDVDLVMGDRSADDLIFPGPHHAGRSEDQRLNIQCGVHQPAIMRRTALPRLGWCEMLVALTAPKGRIDEYIGDHHEELARLVRRFGLRKGMWICRCRLLMTTFRMVPAIAIRAIRLFYSVN